MAWRSSYQDMRATSATGHGTEADEDAAKIEAEIAMSTAGAETHAMAETTKLGRHHSFAAEELDIAFPKPMIIYVDASAAKGFADSIGKKTRMKHIDVHQNWVKLIRNAQVCLP